jgi:hypothetical protein
MVQSPPAVAAYGDVSKLESFEYFDEAVEKIALKGRALNVHTVSPPGSLD